jgi:hypothetical protein
MGRFHRHDDGTVHTHEHDHPDHVHDHDHAQDHGDHSRYQTGKQRIDVLEAIFAENDVLADANRAAFESNGIRTLNLMSSPGSGKTTILQATLDELAGEFAIGVIEGDIATDLDAAKLAGRGAQVSLLNTSNGFGGECHLDAPMVNRALPGLDLTGLDLVIIENVGNLVCPAEFDVGEHAKAMVLTWCRTWTSTWTPTSRMSARSTRQPRSCRSAPAPETAWAPGSAGYGGSRKAPRPDRCKRFARSKSSANDLQQCRKISGLFRAPHRSTTKPRQIAENPWEATNAGQIRSVMRHMFNPPKGGNR